MSKGVKIGVKEPGLYRIDAKDIRAHMGLLPGVAKGLVRMKELQLTNRGLPVAILPASDGSALYFYGEAIDSIYTDTNVYLLTAGQPTIMPTIRQNGPGLSGTGDPFTDSLHIEQDLIPATALFFDPEEDYWLWAFLTAGDPDPGNVTKDFPFFADGASGPGQLAVHLFGASDSGKVDEHHARVYLNGNLLDDTHWTGAAPHTAVFPVPADGLLDGANTVTVTALLDGDIPQSFFAVDSFDLTYEHAYRAYNEQLLFTGDGNADVTIDNFSSNRIRVLDITDPRYPSIVGKTSIGGGPGSYWVQFKPAASDRPYCAASLDGARKPASLGSIPLLGVKDLWKGAEYLVIADQGLVKAARELAQLRKSKGLKTKVVTMDQIYDEFSWGIVNPHAITAFLKYAAAASRHAPRFVVFAGNGSIDYKNNLGFDDCQVPTVMASTPYGLFPADGRLLDITGDDDIPDLAAGRIPAVTEAELRTYVAKLAAYEATNSDWKSRVIFVADNPDVAGDFPADKEDVASIVPLSLNLERIYMPPLTAAEARTNLLNGIKNGALSVNYLGHSGYNQLAAEGLLTKSDVPALGNGSKLPVFTAMTCMMNHFAFPGQTFLGQTLVKRGDGGGIVVWAPTSLVTNDESKLLDVGLWQRLFQPETRSFGEAVAATVEECGKTGVAPYVLQTYTLLGDPAIWLKR